jgi:outer membrane immunogenic protein
MKTIIVATASAVALSTFVPAAGAQTAPSRFYGTLGYGHATRDELNLGAVQGRLGYRWSRWFGIEGDVLFGVQDDSLTIDGDRINFDLKHAEAIFAVVFLPLGENTDILARAGYGHAKIRGSSGDDSATESQEVPAAGVGLQHHFDGVNGVRADYTRFGDANVWSIAYSRRF